MKLTVWLPIFIGTALAAPLFDESYNHHHHHHNHKRNEDVVYVTNVVMVDSNNDIVDTSAVAPTTASATAASPTLSLMLDSGSSVIDHNVASEVTLVTSTTTSSSEESPSSSDYEEYSSTSSAATFSSSTSSAAASSSSSSSSDDASASGTVGAYARQAKGIAYSPYTSSGSCKSASEIQTDMELLSTFDIIRLYAPDCNSVEQMLKTMTSSQQIFAGLYYLDTLESDIELLATQVKTSSRGWDAIHTVSIGNEWINSGTYDLATVISAIANGKSYLSSAGWTGNVVTVDTVPVFEDNPSLCDHVDYVTVNQHPFFSGNTAPEDSGTFLADTISTLKSLCSGKNVMITETGWPTEGDNYGSCVPSVANQLTAIKAIVENSDVAENTLMFTTYNDYWKNPGTYGVEQHWGLFTQSYSD